MPDYPVLYVPDYPVLYVPDYPVCYVPDYPVCYVPDYPLNFQSAKFMSRGKSTRSRVGNRRPRINKNYVDRVAKLR